MKRKLKWLGVGLAVLLLGVGTALLLLPRDRITPQSWKQIRLGMTEKEVEGILGGTGINDEEFEEFWALERNGKGKQPIIDNNNVLEESNSILLAGQKR